MVPKNIHPIEIGLRPFGFSVETFSALAGLEVKLGQTWSQHGPDMVPKIRHSIEMVLRQCRFSVENFSALAGRKVKLVQTWSQHGPDMAPEKNTPETCALDYIDSVLKISEV